MDPIHRPMTGYTCIPSLRYVFAKMFPNIRRISVALVLNTHTADTSESKNSTCCATVWKRFEEEAIYAAVAGGEEGKEMMATHR